MKTTWDTSGTRFRRLYGCRAAKLIAVAIVSTILSQPSPLAAAENVNDLPGGGVGRVSVVVDGDTVRLKDGNADIRLIGLQGPKLSLGRNGFKD